MAERLYPTPKIRWCNHEYKLDAKKQLEEFLLSQGFYCVHYIGYCLDEEKRWRKREKNTIEIYPLVQEGIMESTILEWAKGQPLFNHYYKTQHRCGCMLCPMAAKMQMAYTLKYYPEWFDYMIQKMRETEIIRSERYGRPISVTSSDPKYNADYLDNIIRTKWLPILNEAEKNYDATHQISMFD